ncbi:MAG: helix-turn-helix domain-containing protein [Phycisphaerae bacterium]|jgi:DNA-binding IclR family transcriptional regulator|nr:helix-turn-helix domain-containing protein [Phycisphaerae bacterium]
MEFYDCPAPALARGLAVLQQLAVKPLTLDALARTLDLPKASLLRLCRTLETLGLVGRQSGTKAFFARAQVVPIESAGMVGQVETVLSDLAAETGQTTEWYVYNASGMVLLRRADPPRGEVAVVARPGFTQGWSGELDAVVALGLAFFRDEPIDYRSNWTYVAPGERGNLTVRDARRIVAEARESSIARDPQINANGVRRTAAVVARQGRPLGILAVAEYAGLGETPPPGNTTAALVRAATALPGGTFSPDVKTTPDVS